MSKTIKLNSTEILNKKFESRINGYDPLEVDKYLDLILSDYVNYENIVKSNLNNLNFKEKIIKSKEKEIKLLNEEISNLRLSIAEIGAKSSNSDIIKRVSKIEAKIKSL